MLLRGFDRHGATRDFEPLAAVDGLHLSRAQRRHNTNALTQLRGYNSGGAGISGPQLCLSLRTLS